MEYRKIIEFGKSSFVVSIPKTWMMQKGLKKGDTLFVTTGPNRLTLSPVVDDDSKKERMIEIDTTGKTLQEIKFRLVSAYIRNFNSIVIKDNDLKNRSKDIREIIHDLMSLEVLEENEHTLSASILLSPDQFKPMELIRKMDRITKEMIKDSKNSIGAENYTSIKARDSDVNRLSYVVFRTLKGFQYDPGLAIKAGLKHDEIISTWVAAENIEKIADRAKWITKLLKRISMNSQDRKEFTKLYSKIEKYYIDSIEIFYSKDKEAAFSMGTRYKMLIKECRDYNRHSGEINWVPVILEKLKDIISDSKKLLTYVCNAEDYPVNN